MAQVGQCDGSAALPLREEPRPGEVKTRLCPQLTPVQAAACHEAFLEDLLRRVNGVAGRLVLCATPDHGAPRLERLASVAGAELVWQGVGDLGERMRKVLVSAALQDAAGVVIGADSPDLPLSYLEAAFRCLEEPGLVLGPSADGGYYLVGCRGVVPSIFNLGPAWGGPRVFSLTLEALRNLGLEHHQLPRWEDVDDMDGLRRLATRLRTGAATRPTDEFGSCERMIESLTRQGVSL